MPFDCGVQLLWDSNEHLSLNIICISPFSRYVAIFNCRSEKITELKLGMGSRKAHDWWFRLERGGQGQCGGAGRTARLPHQTTQLQEVSDGQQFSRRR